MVKFLKKEMYSIKNIRIDKIKQINYKRKILYYWLPFKNNNKY
jgi:hypothetical protein